MSPLDINATPNPPNSPIEKLLPDTMWENVEPRLRASLSENPTRDEILRAFSYYDRIMADYIQRHERQMVYWANTHTHDFAAEVGLPPADWNNFGVWAYNPTGTKLTRLEPETLEVAESFTRSVVEGTLTPDQASEEIIYLSGTSLRGIKGSVATDRQIVADVTADYAGTSLDTTQKGANTAAYDGVAYVTLFTDTEIRFVCFNMSDGTTLGTSVFDRVSTTTWVTSMQEVNGNIYCLLGAISTGGGSRPYSLIQIFPDGSHEVRLTLNLSSADKVAVNSDETLVLLGNSAYEIATGDLVWTLEDFSSLSSQRANKRCFWGPSYIAVCGDDNEFRVVNPQNGLTLANFDISGSSTDYANAMCYSPDRRHAYVLGELSSSHLNLFSLDTFSEKATRSETGIWTDVAAYWADPAA